MAAPRTYEMTLKCTQCFFQGVYVYPKGESTKVHSQVCTNCGLTGTTATPDPLFEKKDITDEHGG